MLLSEDKYLLRDDCKHSYNIPIVWESIHYEAVDSIQSGFFVITVLNSHSNQSYIRIWRLDHIFLGNSTHGTSSGTVWTIRSVSRGHIGGIIRGRGRRSWAWVSHISSGPIRFVGRTAKQGMHSSRTTLG